VWVGCFKKFLKIVVMLDVVFDGCDTLLAESDSNITENIILPKSSTLIIIRFKHQSYDDPQEVEGAYCLENIQRNHVVKLRPQRSDHHWASS
jgi:hypothetical protein